MAYVFSVAPGYVAAITDTAAVPISFSMDAGMPLYGAAQSIQIKTEGNYQLTISMSNFLYLCVFGELPGDMVIQGVCFAGECDSSGLLPWTSGLDSAINIYNTNAISITGAPVMVTLGATSLFCFLVGGTFGITSPESNLGMFSYQLKAIPG